MLVENILTSSFIVGGGVGKGRLRATKVLGGEIGREKLFKMSME